MKIMTIFIILTSAALSLSACGDNTGMDHSTMDHGAMSGDAGQAAGVIVSVSPDGKAVTVDHEAIEGIGMSAMTMGFEIAPDVDLSGFKKGDTIRFAVNKDGSIYRITALCNIDTDGADCLNVMTDAPMDMDDN